MNEEIKEKLIKELSIFLKKPIEIKNNIIYTIIKSEEDDVYKDIDFHRLMALERYDLILLIGDFYREVQKEEIFKENKILKEIVELNDQIIRKILENTSYINTNEFTKDEKMRDNLALKYGLIQTFKKRRDKGE